MSIGRTIARILYLGSDTAPVASLASFDGDDRTYLVTQTTEAPVALDHLMRDHVSCVVCENALLSADHQELLHRISTLDADLPVVVVVTDGEQPTVPDHLYDVIHRRDRDAATLPALLGRMLADGPEATPSPVSGREPPEGAGPQASESGGLAPEELLAVAPDHLARIGCDGTIRMVSASVAERMGIRRDGLVGRQLSEVVDAATTSVLLETGTEAVEAAQRRQFTEEIGGRQFQLTFDPLDEESFELTVRDVTALTRAVRAYREERGFLKSVVEGHPDVFVVLDADYGLVRWNDRLNELTGLADEELSDASALDLLTAPGEATVARRLEALVSSDTQRVELGLQQADGAVIPHEFSGGAVRDGGDVQFLCATGRDVSERRAAERERDQLIEELRRSNEELEQFAYVASHDLKEPLRMISSYLELLERRYAEDLDDDGREFVEFAVEGAHRMQTMVDDLLEYSRVGRTDDAHEPVDCEAVLERVVHTLQVSIQECDATVEVGDLPVVLGDRNRLFQLFQNLVDNAIAYNGESPHVAVSATREGDEWVFAVDDDGEGIPTERIDRVFDLFYRSDVQESTGIGLALVKKIAESHGGSVDVESTVGEGSTFYVRLPGRDGDNTTDAP